MALELTDIKNFEDLGFITTITKDDIFPITDVSASVDNKISIETLAQNLNVLGGGLYLSADHSSGKELATDLTAGSDGWYTVAKVGPLANRSGIADFFFSWDNAGATMKVHTGFHNGAGPTPQNTNIEILSINQLAGAGKRFLGARIVCDSAASTGAYLQIKVALSGDTGSGLQVLKSSNTGRGSGWELIDAYYDNAGTTTLPDGTTTPDTFIEAGAEYPLSDSTSVALTGIYGIKTSDSNVRLTVPFEEIPKQGASVVDIDYGSATVTLISGGSSVVIDSSFVEGTPTFTKNRCTFNLTKSTSFTGFSLNEEVQMKCESATDAKVVLS